MRDKINIEEGIKSLERVLLMMNYDNKKTLSENRTYVLEQQTGVKLTFDGPYLRDTNQKHTIDPGRLFTNKNSTDVYYTFTNTTNQPVFISEINIEPDIKKTGVSQENYTKSPIKPGEKGRIDLKIQPLNYCDGYSHYDNPPEDWLGIGRLGNVLDTQEKSARVKVSTNVGTQTFTVKIQKQKISKEEIQYCKEYMSKSSRQTHRILEWGAFIIGVCGLLWPPLLLVSVGVELVDAFMYYREGDDFMFGLTFSLALILGPFDNMIPKGMIKKPIKILVDEILSVIKTAGKWSDELIRRMSPEAANLVKWVAKNFDTIFTKAKSIYDSTGNAIRTVYELGTEYGNWAMKTIFWTLKFTVTFVKMGIKVGAYILSYSWLYEILKDKSSNELESVFKKGEQGLLDETEKSLFEAYNKIKSKYPNTKLTFEQFKGIFYRYQQEYEEGKTNSETIFEYIDEMIGQKNQTPTLTRKKELPS